MTSRKSVQPYGTEPDQGRTWQHFLHMYVYDLFCRCACDLCWIFFIVRYHYIVLVLSFWFFSCSICFCMLSDAFSKNKFKQVRAQVGRKGGFQANSSWGLRERCEPLIRRDVIKKKKEKEGHWVRAIRKPMWARADKKRLRMKIKPRFLTVCLRFWCVTFLATTMGH